MQLITKKSNKNQGVIESEGGGSENSTTTGENGEKSGGEDTATIVKNAEKSGSRENVTCMRADTGAFGAAPAARVVVERKFQLQFAVAPDFMEMLKREISLLSTMYPQGITFEMVFTVFIKDYLDRHDPERRAKRRGERKERAAGRVKEHAPQKIGADVKPDDTTKRRKNGRVRRGQAGTTTPEPRVMKTDGKNRWEAERTRHILQTVRDEVFTRDGGRCTFVGENGKRCNSRWNLEIDHIAPVAKGGNNSPDNLRLLCAKHNKLPAERQFGKDKIEKYYRRVMIYSTNRIKRGNQYLERIMDDYSGKV